MSIWRHATETPLTPWYFRDRQKCPFCSERLRDIGSVPHHDNTEFAIDHGVDAECCPVCGWWKLTRSVQGTFSESDPYTPDSYSHRTYAAIASLRALDLASDRTPLDEVRQYLLAREEAKYALHPRLFEETVASVFADFGYEATVTSYSGDGGVDIILNGANGEVIGVQVKRWKNAIEVAQIRELVGALVLGGLTNGVFVTTSDFQSGCHGVASEAENVGLPIALVNGTTFLDYLRIAQIQTFSDYDLTQPPFVTAKLNVLRYNHGGCNEDGQYIWE